MADLRPGQTIAIQDGGEATVISQIGEGGQGTVYLARYNNKNYALKWYNHGSENENIRENIEMNIDDGSPRSSFLWPKYITAEFESGNFGYLMELIPKEYDSFVDILNTYKLEKLDKDGRRVKRVPVNFTSLAAMITAAINIVDSFEKLHRQGKSYQDLNDGGFFINLATGDVLVCDCDNIFPDMEISGIAGKPGYMAPEIVRGVGSPDTLTDRYSLAVVLFKLLFRGDPLEGRRVIQNVVLTEEADLRFYGKEPIFIFDPNDSSNAPVRGIHDNPIKFWKMYPNYIKEAFIKSFTEGLREPNKRIIENDWKKLLIQLRGDIIACTCGRTTFSTMFINTPQGNYRCPRCGQITYSLMLDGQRIPIFNGKKLYRCQIIRSDSDYMTPGAEIIENKIKRGVFGIRNLSEIRWSGKMPDGSSRIIEKGNVMPIWNNIELDFGDGHKLTRK